jgi:hypothetical protein
MDNMVELAATHLRQSAIAENEIGKQPVAAVAEVAGGAGKEKQKKKRLMKPNFSRRRCAAKGYISLPPAISLSSLRPSFIFFANRAQ